MFKLVLLMTCATFPFVKSQQPCLGAPQNPYSFAASPLSCRHYTICMEGDTITGKTLQCPEGLFFEPQNQLCGQSSCNNCSPFGVQNLPHPDNCNQFIECIMGHREIRTCPSGLLFDRRASQCNQEHLVTCGDETATTEYLTSSTECPTVTTEPPTPSTECPTASTEDPSTTTITPYPWTTTTPYPWTTTTPYPWTTPNPNLPVCLPGQIFHAHPSDCTRFFLCINMVLWSNQCPNNLHWNQSRNTCDLPQSAGCLHSTTAFPPTGTTPWPEPTDPTLFPPAGRSI